MGLFDKIFKFPNYDDVEADHEKINLLVMTESKDRQAQIKKLAVGSPLFFNRKKQNGHTVFVAHNAQNGLEVGELSYGTSDYIAQNYPDCKLIGKVYEIGNLTPMGNGIQVRIVYKVYKK